MEGFPEEGCQWPVLREKGFEGRGSGIESPEQRFEADCGEPQAAASWEPLARLSGRGKGWPGLNLTMAIIQFLYLTFLLA